MTAIVYPAGLPSPIAAPFQPAERRLLSSLPGPRNSRPFSTDLLAAQPLEFVFRNRAEVQAWLDWGRDDLSDWAAWFAASWPQPQGGVGARRFIGAPSYPEFLPKSGGWRARALCQVRGAGLLPQTPNYQHAVEWDRPLVYWKLDEALGATVGADSGTLGLPLSIDPTKTVLGVSTLCHVGSAMQMLNAGANPSIAAHNAALNFGAGDFTIAALVKIAAAPVISSNIVGHGLTNVDYGNWGLQVTSAGCFGLVLYSANSLGAAHVFTSAEPIVDGLVHRVIARRSGDAITLMQDDEFVVSATFSGSIWASSSPVGVGCNPWASGSDSHLGLLSGVVDEIAIWNRAVSDARLAAHFAAL